MPARKSKQTAKRTVKQTTTARKPKSATAAAGAAQTRGGGRRTPRVRASWKPVRQPTKDYVLHTFDAGIRLLTHKVPDSKYSEVQNALIAARNQVAASLETVQVPPTKHDYSHLSTTLVNLKDLKQQLEQRHASLTATLDTQERELQKLEDEKVYLQDFGKRPEKHHPLLLGPQEKELHLNFDTVK